MIFATTGVEEEFENLEDDYKNNSDGKNSMEEDGTNNGKDDQPMTSFCTSFFL